MILLTEGQTMSRLFDLDWQLLADSVLTIIAVGTLFLFMSYFLFDPVRKLLTDRQNKIKSDLEDARNQKESASDLQKEYEYRLKNIEKEAEEILSAARRNALINEAEIVAAAKGEAGRIIEKSRREAALEKQKMEDDVKKEMIAVAYVMAGKILGMSIDAQIQERLINETLSDIREETWLR